MTTTIQTEETDQLTVSPGVLAPVLQSDLSNRAHWTAARKAECLAQFRESGLSQREFAKKRKMPVGNLSRWLRKERAGNAAASREDGPLVEIPLATLGDGSAGAQPVMIHLPGGVRLEVAPGTDTAWLGRLLGGLLRCSA